MTNDFLRLTSSVSDNIVYSSMDSSPRPPYRSIPADYQVFNLIDLPVFINVDICSPHDRDNMVVTKVRWYKNRDTLAHELLVFTLKIVAPSYTAFVAVERGNRQEAVTSRRILHKLYLKIPQWYALKCHVSLFISKYFSTL